LSGGEKKRLQLLAVLFKNPNFLVLDEPTNDLDLMTLSVLEDFLEQYQGCVIIVSHDRYFMDKLVDHLFVFEGEGVIDDFPGNYTDWRISHEKKKRAGYDAEKKEAVVEPKKEQPKEQPKPQASTTKKKLSFKEKTELENLGKELPVLEARKVELNNKLVEGNIPYTEMNLMIKELDQVNKDLERKELRWLELSELNAE
jgi:ATP-binding cassette subfamily F protein uup